MIILCANYRNCGVNGGGCCAINAFGKGTVSFGTCLRSCDRYVGPDRAPLIAELEAKYAKTAQQESPRITPGVLVRRAVHFALDCIDAFVRPRARHRLWIIDQIKTCGICIERQVLIDYYCLHLWNRLRRRFSTEAT